MGDGTITTIAPHGSSYVLATGINNNGAVTGLYVTDTGHGFIRDANGTITTFGVRHSEGAEGPFAINGKGAVTGSFFDSNEIDVHGLLRTP